MLRLVTAALLAALALTACGSKNELSPDPAACKAALQAQYLKAQSLKAKPGGNPSGAEPGACTGLPKAEVKRFIAQIRTGRLRESALVSRGE